MHNPDSGMLLTIAIIVTVFTFGAVIAISVTWLQNRPKMKAIEVLKAYAERGEEPPAGVAEAVAKINWPFPAPPAPHVATRGEHLQHVAGSLGLALGALAVIWWQAPTQHDHPGWLLITAVFVAIFFTASAAARIVAALTTRDGDR
jgi:hypothetical protein